MDRGIPTEAVLAEMRDSRSAGAVSGGHAEGALDAAGKAAAGQALAQARPGVKVKLLPQEGELYVLAESRDRVAKERAMRRRQLKWLWGRLKQLAAMKLTREELLMKLGAANKRVPSAWRLVEIEVAKQGASFSYRLESREAARARRREGRYLLRTNLTENDPAKLWSLYLQLVAVEEAFKNLKGDLAIRPIFHQAKARRSAHLHRLPGLLSACHAGPAAAYAGARTHAAQRAREVRRRADDRCASADHRRSRAAADPLHPARARTQTAARQTQTRNCQPQPPPKISAGSDHLSTAL